MRITIHGMRAAQGDRSPNDTRRFSQHDVGMLNLQENRFESLPLSQVMAIYPDREKVFFNSAWLEALPNRLAELSVRDSHFAAVVRVCDIKETDLRFLSDVVTQQLICFARS